MEKKKLSKEFTFHSRKILYGKYVKEKKQNHFKSFEDFCRLHCKEIVKPKIK